MKHAELLCALLLAFVAAAQADDASAPLNVDARHWEADRASGVALFTGDVEITKGTIHITADEARLRAVDDNLKAGTIIGKPATFHEAPQGKPPISGEAQRIEYDAEKGIVTLTGKAWAKQGNDLFKGESIRYDIKKGKVEATSDKATPERVKIVFQPQTAKPDAAAPQTPASDDDAKKDKGQ